MRTHIAAALISSGFCLFSVIAHTEQAQDAKRRAVEMNGVDLYLHSAEPTFGKVEDPTFWVHAARGESVNDSQWSLEDARAVVYRATDEDLVLAAKSGTFDKDRRAAQLAGGVRVVSGTMVVELEEIAWDDTERVAKSESVAKLSDGSNEIIGDSIHIYPDTDKVNVGGGTATIQLAAAVDEPEKKSEKSASDIYQRLDIEEQHGTSGSIKGAPLQRIEGPVRMKLIGKDPKDTLSIHADLVTMAYAEDSRSPAKVELKGHVAIKQEKNEIRANEGMLDLNARTAKFTGDVLFTGDRISNASGPSLDLNLDTGEWKLGPSGEVMSIDISNVKDDKPKEAKP
jgi:hypothetical protein